MSCCNTTLWLVQKNNSAISYTYEINVIVSALLLIIQISCVCEQKRGIASSEMIAQRSFIPSYPPPHLQRKNCKLFRNFKFSKLSCKYKGRHFELFQIICYIHFISSTPCILHIADGTKFTVSLYD